MKCPAEIYTSSCRSYQGIQELHYPFHDKTVTVTNCGRLCLYRKKINLSTCLAGQAVGIQEVEDGIWLVSFMDYDLGYIDLEVTLLVTAGAAVLGATALRESKLFAQAATPDEGVDYELDSRYITVERLISASDRAPHCLVVRANSVLRISTTFSTPACPNADRPQT